MENTQRQAARDQRDQLLTLVNGWDPVGLLESGAPRDKYDYLVDDLLGLLSSNATHDEIVSFLEREIAGRLGAKLNGAVAFANKAIAWFEMASMQQ